MLIAFSVCQRDEANAITTLEWAHSLDGRLPYDAILSVGDGVEVEPIQRAMDKLFRSVTEINSYAPNTWPHGKNEAFQNLVRYLDEKRSRESFLWWEPDAIPLKKGWLQAIEAEHLKGGKAFTGCVHDALKLMECVGVYPPNFMEYSPHRGMLCRAAPWDRCCGEEIIQHVWRVNHLIQCVNDVDGLPPTFNAERGAGNAELSLEFIKPSAVLFHKNKDGSLVEQLSKGAIKRFIGGLFKKAKPEKVCEPITVVFAPCARDIDQAVHHARWLEQFGKKWANKSVVAVDGECDVTKVAQLCGLLRNSFSEVRVFFYPTPPDKSYPAVANFAFGRVAEMMAQQSAAWFWAESDTVVLQPESWLDVLQKEYEAGGKPFMGPVVKESGYGHANGSCVYPADCAQRIPKALRQTAVAWDFAARDELNGDVHDASGVIFHLWGVVNGQPSATNGAQPPVNITAEMARRMIPKTAVVLHRVKDLSLIDVLMAGGWK